MNKEEKKKRAILIADTIQMLLNQIDVFTSQMTEEDIAIMLESKEALEEKISYNQSAMALICALGGNYDSSEDEMKIETLNCLIKIIKVRNEYKEKVKQQKADMIKRNEKLNMMGIKKRRAGLWKKKKKH